MMEGVCLGLFMMSASLCATVLENPDSVVHAFFYDGFHRLCFMGAAMGITASAIIYSPVGKLSGAHMNPAVTWSFFILGKIEWRDAVFYTIFQCVGGVLVVFMMALILREPFTDSPVNYVVTVPGKYGPVDAFLVEVTIAFFMMTMILTTSNSTRLSKYTGALAGGFVMFYVVISAPVSGFSMNPARTIASAIPAWNFQSFWIYMTAPFIGMFSSALLFKRLNRKVMCCKMHHSPHYTCIFICSYCDHQSSPGSGSKTKEEF